jgi:hypothetical protein
VRRTADALTDPVTLARIARTHPDWVLRKAAVERLRDARVLSSIASSDSDEDVRRAAFLLLDEKAIAGIAAGKAAPSVRAQAVSFLTDQRNLAELAVTGPREAALDRLIEVRSQPADPRNRRVQAMLLDPALVRSLGPLELDVRIGVDEKRYVRDDPGSGSPPTKGKVLVETVSLAIRRGDEVLFRKSYRGHKARKGEAFSSGSAVQGGYLTKVNAAEVDCVEIAQALLAGLREGELRVASASKDKYIHAAAAALSDTWRGGGEHRIEPESGEAEEDD